MDTVMHLQGNPASDLTPLILIHAISGLALPYLSLGPFTHSRSGDDRPVYGISSPMFRGNKHPAPKSISELATQYVEIIQDEIQPEGPYLLGGWSMGGMIAMEMARVFQSQGEVVEHVILIDSMNPENIPPFEDSSDYAAVAAMTYNKIAKRMEWPEVDLDFEYEESDSIFDTPIDSVSSDSDDDGEGEEEEEASDDFSGPQMFFRMQQHIYNGLRMITSEPKKCAWQIRFLRNTDVTLIKCKHPIAIPQSVYAKRKDLIERMASDPKLGWPSEQYRSLKTIPFAAEHDSCLDQEHAGELTKLIRNVLDKVSI